MTDDPPVPPEQDDALPPQPAAPGPDPALWAAEASPETRQETRVQTEPAWFGKRDDASEVPLPPPHEPITREHERVWALDGLRGVAILGILPANLPSFAYPTGPVGSSVNYAGGGVSEVAAHVVLGTLVDVKFITLFAFLFGVGIALQTARAERSQALLSFRPYFVWRLALLAGIGALHAVGLWYGDILFTYAGCGLAVFALRSFVKVPAVFAALGIVGICMTAGIFTLFGLASLNRNPDAPRDREALLAWADGPEAGPRKFDMDDPLLETWVHRHGSYADQVNWRAKFWLMLTMFVFLFYAWRLCGLMCLGVAAHEVGWIHEPPPKVLKIGLVVGFGLGIPLELAFAYGRLEAAEFSGGTLVDGLHYLSVVVLAAGYAALCFSFSDARWKAWPLRPLANAGRMALTVYLSESVLCTAIFYSWGLGYFGEPSRAQLWALTGVLWLVLLAGATVWLTLFRMGPVEWAWRSLATAELQPLLRRPQPSPSGYPEADLKEGS